LLQHRKIHRHVTAERHGHRFDDMHQAQFGVGGAGERLRASDNRMAFFGQVDGDQYVLVGHGAFLLACRSPEAVVVPAVSG